MMTLDREGAREFLELPPEAMTEAWVEDGEDDDLVDAWDVLRDWVKGFGWGMRIRVRCQSRGIDAVVDT